MRTIRFSDWVEKQGLILDHKVESMTGKQMEIERQIDEHAIDPPIANAMRALGRRGFEFAGYGEARTGGRDTPDYEDFSLENDVEELFVNFRSNGEGFLPIRVAVSHLNGEKIFEGDIVAAMQLIEEIPLMEDLKNE